MMNVYATKQTSETVEYFPCVVSHTDTVHNLDSINVVEEQLMNAQNEEKLSFKAYNDHGQPTGIGGDDKCGVFACMKMLQETNDIKAAFFVAEETGCHGSMKADEEFFSNVGYVIEFDAPENWMVTQFCFGQELFEQFLEENKSNSKAEYYLPSIVNELLKSGKATVKTLKSNAKWFGVTYSEDKPKVQLEINHL